MQPVRSAETLEIYWPWPHVHVVSATQFQQPRTAGQSGRLGINARNLFNEIEIGDGKLDAMQLNKLSRRDDTAKETEMKPRGPDLFFVAGGRKVFDHLLSGSRMLDSRRHLVCAA
jgi:hypothetical protein